MTPPKTKRRRPPNSGSKATGAGPLWEVRHARAQSRAVLAPLLGLKRATLAWAERQGRAPNDREARHILLGMAQDIPKPKRSPELEAWIEEQEAEFRARPLGRVFL